MQKFLKITLKSIRKIAMSFHQRRKYAADIYRKMRRTRSGSITLLLSSNCIIAEEQSSGLVSGTHTSGSIAYGKPNTGQ